MIVNPEPIIDRLISSNLFSTEEQKLFKANPQAIKVSLCNKEKTKFIYTRRFNHLRDLKTYPELEIAIAQLLTNLNDLPDRNIYLILFSHDLYEFYAMVNLELNKLLGYIKFDTNN